MDTPEAAPAPRSSRARWMPVAALVALLAVAGGVTAYLKPKAHRRQRETPIQLTGPIELSITIDDVPVRVHSGQAPTQQDPAAEKQVIDAYLDAFAAEQVPAAYGFVNGKRVDEAPGRLALLEAWRKAGHPLGNHTYAHSQIQHATATEFIQDIDRDEDVLKRLYGASDERPWKVFRYPYLNEGPKENRDEVRAHLRERGYRVAPVSVDLFDYAFDDAYQRCKAKGDKAAMERIEQLFAKRAVECLKGSAETTARAAGRPTKHVLLLHVGELQAKLLLPTLRAFKGANVKFITLDEALTDPYLQKRMRPDPKARRACGRHKLSEIKNMCPRDGQTAGAEQEHDD